MIDRALVVDDEFLIRDLLVESLGRKRIETIPAGSGEEAVELLKEHDFQIAFVDLKMDKMSGLQVLEHCLVNYPHILFVIMTAYGTVETAVKAIKLGAFDFIMKPFSPDQLDIIIEKGAEWMKMSERQTFLQRQINPPPPKKSPALGDAPAFQRIRTLIERVAPTNATVLITGESGTGKEVIAREIQRHADPEDKKPFIKMNCAAVPETIIESELFGHEQGAFTGATSRRVGRFELADGGTLLLDEIGEISPSVQAKLLRVIQESEFERVGGTKTISVDVRILATTNRDLKQEVIKGNFREDLYFRLNVFPVHLPPLRERGEDVINIARLFLKRHSTNFGKNLSFSPAVLECFRNYHWPGNIRELENLVERLAILADENSVDVSLLPKEILFKDSNITSPQNIGVDFFHLGEIEKWLIKKALLKESGNKTRAARRLGFSVRTLHNKLGRTDLSSLAQEGHA